MYQEWNGEWLVELAKQHPDILEMVLRHRHELSVLLAKQSTEFLRVTLEYRKEDR